MLRTIVVLAVAASIPSFSSAFLASSPLPVAAGRSAATGVCSVRASQQSESVSRRSLLAAGFAAGLALPSALSSANAQDAPAAAPAPAAEAAPAAAPLPVKPEAFKVSGTYATDVTDLLGRMKAATAFKKGDSGMKPVVEDCRAAMNTFVAYYRRNNKVAGAASFSTLYTAISTLSGHFQNYGAEYPVPEKRKKRLSQQYAEIEKQVTRGR